MRLPSLFSILCISSCLIAPVDAGIYKWVDENGQVHYGERPVGEQAEKLRIKVETPAPAATDEAETDEDKKAVTAAPQEQPAALPDELVEKKLSSREKRKRCKAAKERLASIQSRPRMKEKDAKGNVRALSPKERNQRIKLVRKKIKDYCR